jgi:hypothetical protein
MSEETTETTTTETPKIEPLTTEELAAIIKRIEDEKDFDSDLARAVFTLMVSGYEYQSLYNTLQAYYAASASACHDLASALINMVGFKDHKKMQKLYKLAGKYAGEVPARAQAILAEPEVTEVEMKP